MRPALHNPKSTLRNPESGFSLVELAIVLVILGLLVGGVLSGRSLIRASELRSLTTQFQNFSSAHYAFRDKYYSIAGTMANATQFWGAASAVDDTACSVALAAGVSGSLTCNGEGDGYVNRGGQDRAETVLYWQHLSNAGLIEGKYSGFSHSGASCCFVSTANSARGKLANSIWVPLSNAGTLVIARFNYSFGKQQASCGGMPACAGVDNILRPEELWNIDSKLDDGKPNTGKVMAFESAGSNCKAGTAATDDYTLTYSDVACYTRMFIGG